MIKDGRTVTETAAVGVSRQTLHAWLAKYEAGGFEGLVDGVASAVDLAAADAGDGGGGSAGGAAETPVVGSAADRGPGQQVGSGPGGDGVVGVSVFAPGRSGGADGRRRRRRDWKRWERGRPNELWQMDVVGGFLLADSTQVKALTGVDDHSRFWVSARLMPRERTRPVCEGPAAALGRYGPPEQI